MKSKEEIEGQRSELLIKKTNLLNQYAEHERMHDGPSGSGVNPYQKEIDRVNTKLSVIDWVLK